MAATAVMESSAMWWEDSSGDNFQGRLASLGSIRLQLLRPRGASWQRRAIFASKLIRDWPKPDEIEDYFLAPPGERWFFETGNDGAYFRKEGADGTEHLEPNKGRIDVDLMMWGNPDLGVLLIWSKWGGGHEQAYTSKGDLNRLREFVESSHDTPLPIGLFIPFEKAWTAVKEFLETDGELSKSIEWVANGDLPPNTFPDQGDVEIPRRGARR